MTKAESTPAPMRHLPPSSRDLVLAAAARNHAPLAVLQVKKNKALLSFGDDEEAVGEDAGEAPQSKPRDPAHREVGWSNVFELVIRIGQD